MAAQGLAGQAAAEGNGEGSGLIAQTLQGIADGIDYLGLSLLSLACGLEWVITGELAGRRLQLALGILGGSLDLVFQAHGDKTKELK
ncbi:hypothetical protein [Cyanobium gracile]|uniref:High light inducible protein n=1 Tax=Cyanobium gracile UHCC 0281 TaxID=3110309 RepID=A0ABU5SZ30_9CYAN|nr:hypothetical protein [Cyanobium gracile]MEA5443627.1 hypothetical protein [Cyanobium gracile UHCC 0281]